MIKVIDKRKPNLILLKLLNPGEIFIVDDLDQENIILGCVINKIHFNVSQIQISGVMDHFIAYYMVNGKNAGTIRARHGDTAVERVSLQTSIVTYTL